MASIRKVDDKWRVQIRRTGQKSISKMCRTKAEAERWAREQEGQMDKGTHVGKLMETISDLILDYRNLREDSDREVKDTSSEHYMLKTLDSLLGKKKVQNLEVSDLITYCQDRRKEGAGPYTVNMEISKLGTVLRHVGSIRNLRLMDVVGMARPALNHLKLIGGGGKRDRRPTEDELFHIKEWLSQQTTSRTKQAMPDIIDLSALIGLRRGESFKIVWADLDEKRKVLLVRDRKDPRKKEGNDQEVPLIGNALDIILRQPRVDERIFPFHPQTISKYFKEACDTLGIPDLHWHDLRHEAASSLAEAGWSPHEIKAVTGHRMDAHLDRYVNMDAQKIAQKKIVKPVKEQEDDQAASRS